MEAFGSRANGLELWNSDIDVVVLGVKEPHGVNGGAPIPPIACSRPCRS